MSRARLTRGGAVVWRASCVAAGLAMLVALFPASAPALVNDGAHLDVGAGETITLDGEHRYSESIVVHDGGVVRVGPSGSLILRAPAIYLRDGGIITGAGTASSPNGKTIVLECDTFTILTSGGSVVADGANATSSSNAGNGGSIHIRAAESATLASGTISACGGAGYSSTYYALAGAGGGQIVVRSRNLTMSGSGTRIRASGGDGGDNFEGTTGANGGPGGSIRLYGASVAFGPIVDASGGDGGDAVFHAAGEGGNGGAGGSVAAAWCSRSGTEALDVSGGAAGTGNLRNGIPGPVGTATSTTGVDAQFDPSHTTDGYIEPESQHEYPQSWMWSSTTGGVPLTVWLCQDGFGLYVALRNNSDNERSYDVFIDVNGDGSSAPGTDDLWLTVGPTSALTERRGNGSAWVTQPSASGWSAVATRKWIFPGGYYIREAEFSIPFAKLGLTAGQVKTMRMAIGARPGTAPNLWPSTASDTQPSTWPRLTSVDSWTAFRNVAPGVPPGGWDVSPLVATITVPTPDLAVLVRDHIAGTKPGTAQYRFSTDGGSSWTPWTDAANTLTYWNESTQTVRADDVPLPDSMTNNRVQFRVTDMGGLTGTSPIVTVRKDASSPGGWTSFSPATVVRTTLTPDCTVRVQDVCSGLAVASAEYRYSTDGGTTWSAWSPAACTGTNGTTAQQTITADDVQFQRNSATANKVQFRVRDLAGNLGTSAIYTVAIDAPILGLPPNGSFEVGLPGQIPSLWTASGQPYLDDNPPTSLWAWSAHAVAGHGYDGQQAVHGRIWIGAVVWNPLTGFSRIQMLGRGDLSGAGFLELYMKDVSTGENDPTDIIPWYECRIDAVLTDGTNTVTRPLYVNNTGSVTDSRVATAPGTDGAVWSRYVVPVNDPALDETSLTVGVRWQVRTGNLDVARAPVIGQTAVFSESKVDVVRALDAVAPTSSGSVLGEFWTPYSRRQISWSASDNSGLSKIEFWARSDPGSGFGPWTKIGERTISGYLAAGTTELDLGGPGISEVYTIARDIDGNAEAPPARADDSCGIDKAAPGSWSSFQPSGWVASRTVDCSVTVHDPLSGIRSAPVRVGVTRDLPQTAGPTTWVDQRFVWVGAGTAVCAVDAADPRAPEVVNSVDITKARVFDLKRAPGRKAVAACGDDGLVVLDAADPSQPKTVGASADAPAVSVHAVDLAGIAPRSPLALTADGTSGILTVWGISNPAAPARLSSIDLGAPLRLIAAADGVPAAFCATGSDLVAINLSDPARPEVLDALELKADLVSLATDGRTVYAADEDGVLWAVPWNAGFGIPQNAPSSATGPIAFVDSHAYVADAGDGGLCVVEHVPPAEPWSEHDVPGPSPAASVDATHGIVALAEASRLALYVHGEPMWSFSRDEGLTWSAWAPALDPLGDTNAPATLTAPAVPFGQDSATKNLVRYRAGDAVGWLAESTPFAVRIDTEVGMPTISSSTHPTSAWSANNDPAFSWTPPADLSGIVGYSYLLAPDLVTEPDTISEGSGTATTYADVPDGSWYFRVRARDAAGNWGGAAAKLVRIDTTPPSGTMALAGGAAWTTTRTVSVDSTVTDALSGVSQMRLSADGGTTWGAWQPYAASASVTLPSGDGTKTVAAQYRDAAGNVLALTDAIVLDTNAPPIAWVGITPHADKATWYSSRDATVTWTAVDLVSGIAGYSWCVDANPATVPDTVSEGASPQTRLQALADGQWYFHVRAVDGAGNWGPAWHEGFLVDASAPTVSISVNGGAQYTNDVLVTVSVAATDTHSGLALMRVSPDGGATWNAWEPYAPSTKTKLPPGDGLNTVAVEVADAAVPQNSRVATAGIILDTTPPSGTMALAGGAAWTTTRTVSVDSTVTDALSGVSQMRLSADGGTTWGAWQPYAASASVTLPSGDGTKTVAAQYRDAAGNVLALIDDVVLETSLPTIDSLDASPHEDEQVWYASREATVSWTASDGLAGVVAYSWCVDQQPLTSPDEIADGATTRRNVQLDDALWYFHIRAVDAAGNWGPPRHRALRVDCTPPAAVLSLSGGASWTDSITVSASIVASDTLSGTSQMRFSTDGGTTWGAWQPYAASASVTLPSGDGTKTVAVELRDAAVPPNSRVATDGIGLDTVPPSGTMTLDRGAAYTEDTTVSVDSTVTDTLSGVWQMRFSTDGGTTWGAWQPYAASASVTLPSGDGTKTVAAQYRDAAGNVLALVDDIRLESFRHLEPGAQRVDRWSGDDRFKTAVAISSNSFARAETVVIATGRTFPDALSASALAGTVNGPLLLTDSTSLPTAVRNEIVRLGARRVYIVGGTGAVSSAVETAVAQVPGITAVQRIYGADRYATAAAVCAQVAQLQGPAFCRRAFVARGDDFPDALAAAPVAFAQKMPVLLVKPTSLPDPTRSAITTNRITECIVVGDTGAVSDDVKNQIKNLGVITDRWKGLTRFSTAVEVARNAVLRGWCRWDFVGVAWGRNFPDALSGGVGTGAYRGVLLMSETTSLPPETQAALSANKTSIVGARIFGGTGAVSDGVKNSVANAIKLE